MLSGWQDERERHTSCTQAETQRAGEGVEGVGSPIEILAMLAEPLRCDCWERGGTISDFHGGVLLFQGDDRTSNFER